MKNAQIGIYDNQFSPTNLYGKALELLTEHTDVKNRRWIHVDVGCGFGRIAEPLTKALGCQYLGIDVDSVCLQSLGERGFKTLRFDLKDHAKLKESILRAVGNLKVCSISFLDCLEHLTNGPEILEQISAVAGGNSIPVVVSTPNFLHADVISKLIVGRLDYTSAGLLDHTHVRLFSERLFLATLASSGLRVTKRSDIFNIRSDQHFPAYHPLLSANSSVGGLVEQIVAAAVPGRHINQFLALCLSAPKVPGPLFTPDRNPEAPFLSVVMRTQGKRKQSLMEALVCLAAQDFANFEVVLVGHNLEIGNLVAVEEVLRDLPTEFVSRVRFLRVEGGGRARPLNFGFENAMGHYICALDDDDLVFGNYTQAFFELATASPGKIARSVCVLQNAQRTDVLKIEGTSAAGEFKRIYPAQYDFFQHLVDNHTPNMSVAYPRSLFHEFGLRFDESLTTAEDWDWFGRSAALVGVASSPEITSIYRMWQNMENSYSVESKSDWEDNRYRIMKKLDNQYLILPGSVLPRIRDLLELETRALVRTGDVGTMKVDIESLSLALRTLAKYYRLKGKLVDGISALRNGIWFCLARLFSRWRKF